MKKIIKRYLMFVLSSMFLILSYNFFMAYNGYTYDIFGKNMLQIDLILGILFAILGLIILFLYTLLPKEILPPLNKEIILNKANIKNIEKKYKKIETIENKNHIKLKYKHFSYLYKEYILLLDIKSFTSIFDEIENEIQDFKRYAKLKKDRVSILYIICIVDKFPKELLEKLKAQILGTSNLGTANIITIPFIIESEKGNIISSEIEYKSFQERNTFIQVRNRFFKYLLDIELVKFKNN